MTEPKMGVNSPELNLDLNLGHVPKTISDFLEEFSMINDSSEKSSKLNDYVHMLEDEIRKINGFKSELPLSMLLLNDAIERSKDEKIQLTKTEQSLKVEEFIPLKGNSDAEIGVKVSSDCSRNNAKLWSTKINSNKFDFKTHDSLLNLNLRDEKEEDWSANEKSIQLACNLRGRGGAFVSFKEQPSLPLSTPVAKMNSIDLNLDRDCGEFGCDSLTLVTEEISKSESKPQRKKQRRRWSPELQRRFVNACQQLGGAHAATPKQIRGLMLVDGLTNDEIKSHLQKYRLHIEKVSSTPSNGLWLARDRNGEVSSTNNAGS